MKLTAPKGWAAAALAAAVSVVLASQAAVPPASAATGTPAALDGPAAPQLSAQDRAVMLEQEPYLELDEQVRRVAFAQASSPLAGTRIDVANQTLHVHWVGEAPAQLRGIQESAARRHITVKIVSAAFSEQTLMAAAADLARVAESTRAELSITIHNDGSGLTVRQDGRQVQSHVLDAVGAISARSGIPVTLAERGPRAVLATRGDDRDPHWGGAVTESSVGTCTDSFSMYATGAPARFMLTAAHCTGFRDGQTVTNGVGERMGASDFIHELFDFGPSYDLGVIRLDAGRSNRGLVYSNWTTSNPFSVKGLASGIPRGGTYCVSGAVSTPNCTLVSLDQTVICGTPFPFGRCVYLIEWLSNTGNTAYCHGDSGGPIYYWTSTGIIAAGVVSVGYGTETQRCFASGAISVVSSAVNRIPGLAVVLS